jgi:hypothetical protein
MVNSCAVCGCCTRTDIVREHLEDTLRICDVSAKGLFATQQWRFMDFEIRRSMKFGEVVLQFVQLFRLGGSGF